MTNYQPEVLRKFADRMYTVASLLIVAGGVISGFFGLSMGSSIGLLFDSGGLLVVALGFLGLLFGGVFGAALGWLAGYFLKLGAQMILCHAQVELNSRREPLEFAPQPQRSAPQPQRAAPVAARPRVTSGVVDKSTTRVPEPVRRRATGPLLDADATPIAPTRLNAAAEVKVRCKGCGKRFGGTAESIGGLKACPRCKVAPFDVEAI